MHSSVDAFICRCIHLRMSWCWCFFWCITLWTNLSFHKFIFSWIHLFVHSSCHGFIHALFLAFTIACISLLMNQNLFLSFFHAFNQAIIVSFNKLLSNHLFKQSSFQANIFASNHFCKQSSFYLLSFNALILQCIFILFFCMVIFSSI